MIRRILGRSQLVMSALRSNTLLTVLNRSFLCWRWGTCVYVTLHIVVLLRNGYDGSVLGLLKSFKILKHFQYIDVPLLVRFVHGEVEVMFWYRLTNFWLLMLKLLSVEPRSNLGHRQLRIDNSLILFTFFLVPRIIELVNRWVLTIRCFFWLDRTLRFLVLQESENI